MSVRENLESLLNEIPSHVKLIAVTKNLPENVVMQAYDFGHKLFGENRAPALKERFDLLPDDIQWHFIGHLQTNKVKFIAPKVSMIHSIDSYKLLYEVNKSAKKNLRCIDCLLQFHIAEEDTKYGLNLDEALAIFESPEIETLQNIRIRGVMGMATFTDDETQIRREFRTLTKYFEAVKNDVFANNQNFNEVSMGMSGDYKIAIEEGSTMLRIGSNIFGQYY